MAAPTVVAEADPEPHQHQRAAGHAEPADLDRPVGPALGGLVPTPCRRRRASIAAALRDLADYHSGYLDQSKLYDAVIMPALGLAEQDRLRGSLDRCPRRCPEPLPLPDGGRQVIDFSVLRRPPAAPGSLHQSARDRCHRFHRTTAKSL
jgi:hypothetical protein